MNNCYHCEKNQDKVEKSIPYELGSEMFPLCLSCYDRLPVDKVVYYCQMLVDKMKGDCINANISREYDRLIKQERFIMERVRKFVEEDKKPSE